MIDFAALHEKAIVVEKMNFDHRDSLEDMFDAAADLIDRIDACEDRDAIWRIRREVKNGNWSKHNRHIRDVILDACADALEEIRL